MNMRFDNSTFALAVRVTAVPVLMWMVAACSPVNFSTVKNEGSGVTTAVPTPACQIQTISKKTKIMFLVDSSGSNVEQTGYRNASGGTDIYPSTDPTKSFRGGAINNFVTTYQSKTNFSWGFSTFQNSSAHSYLGSDTNPAFSSNSADMRNAVISFYNSTDYGQTPYAAALHMATRAIQIDPELNSADQPNYFVVLISDGFPTDYDNGYGQLNTAQMNSDIAALRATAPGRVSLSTIYYTAGNQSIASAVSTLQSMASTGGGQFASVNTSNNSFKIDDVISTQVCQ